MTFYLFLRMCLFEHEQTAYQIKRHLHTHNINLHYQIEATLEVNHKLLALMTEVLAAIRQIGNSLNNTMCTHKENVTPEL